MNKNFFIIFSLLFFAFATPALAADLVISPSSGSYPVGQSFTVTVKVSTPDKAANAFAGEVSYPVDKLKVVSISKTNSIINYWPTEPVAAGGVVKYEGVSVNPGYTGSSGTLLQINFRTIAPGVAIVKFKSASVLANDGLGTSILNTLGTATYTVTSLEIPVDDTPVKIVTTPGLPEAPFVTSNTHPDQTAWYKNNSPLINWTIPSNVAGVGLMVNETATTIPSVHSLGPVTGYNVAKLTDGQWYAHVRFVNGNGWGPTTHYRFGIDTVAPVDFVITPNTPGENATTATMTLLAHDMTSGIDHYSFAIDGGSPIIVPATNTWETPLLSPGNHRIVGTAFDKAGNSLQATATFATTGIPSPTIDTYPKELKSGDTLIATGHAYPKSTVVMSIIEKLDNEYSFGSLVYQKNGNAITKEIIADAQGTFTFIYDKKVKSGNYTLSAVAKMGAYESGPSNSVTVLVGLSLFARIVQFLMHFFDLIIPLVAVFALFIGLLMYIRHKYRQYRIRLASDISEMDETIVAQISTLKKAQSGADLKAHEIEFLEKLEGEIKKVREDIRYTRGK